MDSGEYLSGYYGTGRTWTDGRIEAGDLLVDQRLLYSGEELIWSYHPEADGQHPTFTTDERVLGGATGSLEEGDWTRVGSTSVVERDGSGSGDSLDLILNVPKEFFPDYAGPRLGVDVDIDPVPDGGKCDYDREYHFIGDVTHSGLICYLFTHEELARLERELLREVFSEEIQRAKFLDAIGEESLRRFDDAISRVLRRILEETMTVDQTMIDYVNDI